MSKASEYAKKYVQNTRPTLDLDTFGNVKVIENGYLLTNIDHALTPEKALKLGKWILDTFGETE